jgi:methyl-accepting chemotaxis protein
MNFSDLSCKTRLLAVIAVAGLGMIVVGVVGLRALDRSNVNLLSVIDDRLMPVTWINEINSIGGRNLIELDKALMGNDRSEIEAVQTRLVSTASRSEELWRMYGGTVMAEGEQELAEAFWRARTGYIAARNQLMDALIKGDMERARQLRHDEVAETFEAQQEPLDALLALQAKVAKQERADSLLAYRNAQWWSIATIVIGLAVASIWGALLIRSITAALTQAVTTAEQIAKGHLGSATASAQTNEFGRLLTALHEMDTMLLKIVSEVRSGANEVGTAARQLAMGNDDLSQRTQEQASALEETASSMEEMTATVKQNSDNARQANQLAASARGQADQGGSVVGRAVSAMSEINDASNKIADIIRVIDDIAFQTNLLALNAAVEAARAGEQGRGFAVVASEVRNLAQRSATAAKEIKDLIGNSVEKVAAGSALVSESGEMLNEIVNSVKKVADIVAEISAASQEQAAGIDQVNNAVTQMDTVTQQNAALVEEASAASKAMQDRAAQLVQQIAFFKTQGASQANASSYAQESDVAAQSKAPMRTHVTPLRARSTARPTAKTSTSQPMRAVKAAGASGGDVWKEF